MRNNYDTLIQDEEEEEEEYIPSQCPICSAYAYVLLYILLLPTRLCF
jgi:hypothetical protein